jgi:alpha-beta hydrolase superfamily lysophospholipase
MDLRTLLQEADKLTQSPFQWGETKAQGVTLTRKFLETSNPTEKILYSSFESDSIAPHSNLIICHGGFEHSGRYDFLAYTLASKGYLCHSIDLRGQGRSDGMRCGTKNLESFHEDLSIQLKQISNKLPIYIFAHSMGGGIWTTFL